MNKLVIKLRSNILSIVHSKNYGIIIDEDDFKYFNKFNDDAVLIRVLLNDYYYNLKKAFMNESSINIYIRKNNNYDTFKLCSVKEFTHKLEFLIANNELSSSEIKKTLILKDMIDYKKYLLSLNSSFIYYFEQTKKSIKTKEIIKLFMMDNNAFIKKINNVDSNELMVLLCKFVSILNCEKYNFPDNMINNIEYIKSITKDYEILDQVKLFNKPHYLKKMKLNHNLKSIIMDSIPNDFSKLESAVYVYIKLCDIFTHDEKDLYKKDYIINHKDLKRISTIDFDNNIIVCYEYICILAKFLDIIGIDYEICGDKKYGRGHIYLNILYKDLYLKLDPTRGLFDCDMTKIKNNIRLDGIVPIKSNPYTLDLFSDSLEKVYDYLKKEKNKDYKYESDLIKQQREIFNVDNIGIFDKKINLFIDEIKKCDLHIIDKVKYIKLLNKIIFKNDKAVINPMESRINNKSELVVIMSFFNDNKYRYFIYKYPNEVNEISKDFIFECLCDKTLDFINYLDKTIPGIDYEYKLTSTSNKKLLIRQ